MMPRALPVPVRVWARRLGGRPRLDMPLTGALLLIMGFGLMVLYSAGGADLALVLKQGLRLSLGWLALLVLARFPVPFLRLWSPALYGIGLGLLVLVFAFGTVRQGAQRWLDLGVILIQPAELMKLTLPMMLAWYLHRRQGPPGWLDLLASLLLIAVPCALIVEQPDLGTAVLVAACGAFALFLAGLRWRVIGFLALAVAGSTPLVWTWLHDYQRERILTFLNPQADPLGAGWNLIQSKIAVGSGGLFGKGWLNGTQSHLEFLPETSTDFILAVLAEEFGLMGVLLLLGLYLFVIGRGLWIASQAHHAYARILAGSLTLTFAVYVLVNAAMVAGLLPVVGVPLPLVSYGGTSAVSLLAGFGMITAVANDKRSLKT